MTYITEQKQKGFCLFPKKAKFLLQMENRSQASMSGCNLTLLPKIQNLILVAQSSFTKLKRPKKLSQRNPRLLCRVFCIFQAHFCLSQQQRLFKYHTPDPLLLATGLIIFTEWSNCRERQSGNGNSAILHNVKLPAGFHRAQAIKSSHPQPIHRATFSLARR